MRYKRDSEMQKTYELFINLPDEQMDKVSIDQRVSLGALYILSEIGYTLGELRLTVSHGYSIISELLKNFNVLFLDIIVSEVQNATKEEKLGNESINEVAKRILEQMDQKDDTEGKQ